MYFCNPYCLGHFFINQSETNPVSKLLRPILIFQDLPRKSLQRIAGLQEPFLTILKHAMHWSVLNYASLCPVSLTVAREGASRVLVEKSEAL